MIKKDPQRDLLFGLAGLLSVSYVDLETTSNERFKNISQNDAKSEPPLSRYELLPDLHSRN
jgi:hypothetical protein